MIDGASDRPLEYYCGALVPNPLGSLGQCYVDRTWLSAAAQIWPRISGIEIDRRLTLPNIDLI